MDFATRNWFSYINENIRLDEVYRKKPQVQAMPEFVVNYFDRKLDPAGDAAKTWMAEQWRASHIHKLLDNRRATSEFIEPYWTAIKDELEPYIGEVQFEGPLNEEEEEAEPHKNAARISEVLENLKITMLDRTLHRWNKSFKKSLKRLEIAGVDPKHLEKISNILNDLIVDVTNKFLEWHRPVFEFLNLHPDNFEVIKGFGIAPAHQIVEKELAEREDPANIIQTFDDGSYWYNIGKSACHIEAIRMGHCGASPGGNLFSLRAPGEGKRGKSKSYVTIALGPARPGAPELDDDLVAFQIKGRLNQPPSGPDSFDKDGKDLPNHWPKIDQFLKKMNVERVDEDGGDSLNRHEFDTMLGWLKSRNPQINFTGLEEIERLDIEEQILRIDKLLNEADKLKKCNTTELLREWSAEGAQTIKDWFGGDVSRLSFNDLFDGKLRKVISLQSEDQKNLYAIAQILFKENWELPEDPEDAAYNKRRFPTKMVKQKKERRVGELPPGFGTPHPETNPDPRPTEKYLVDEKVADFELVRTKTITIPKGPRAGETIRREEKMSMGKLIAKNKEISPELKEWWQRKQTLYAKDNQWKQVEEALKDPNEIEPMMVILSRDPIDVLRRSDISGIESCHSEGHSHDQCAYAEAKGHGFIAYLVTQKDYDDLMSGMYTKYETADDPEEAYNTLKRPDPDLPNKIEATQWLQKIFDTGTVWASIVDAHRGGDNERLEKLIDAAQDFHGFGFRKLPTRVRGELPDQAFIDAAYAAKDGTLGEWTLVRPEAAVSVEKEPEDKGEITDISDFDDQEIFSDTNPGRKVRGIGVIGRVILRRFVDTAIDVEFAVPEQRVFGRNVPGFVDAVRKWVFNEQKDQFDSDEGEVMPPARYDLVRTGGSWEDNKDGYLLNLFFGEGGVDDRYNDNANVDHDLGDETDDRLGQATHEVEEFVQQANNSLEHTGVSASVDASEEGAHLIFWASASTLINIVLTGWEGFEKDESGYYWRTEKVDDKWERPDGYGIPTQYSPTGDYQAVRQFEELIGLELGSDETHWSVIKKDGIVKLEISYEIGGEDLNESSDVEDFFDYIRDDYDKKYNDIVEKIRLKLVAEEYIDPNYFDEKGASEEHAEWAEKLHNFSYIAPDEDGEMWFTLKNDKGTEYYMPTNVIMPAIPFRTPGISIDHGHSLTALDLLKVVGGKLDGTRSLGARMYIVHTGAAKAMLDKELQKVEQEANAAVAKQMDLDFGDPKYDRPEDAFGVDFSSNIELSTHLVKNETLPTSMVLKLPDDSSRYLGFGMRIVVKSVNTDKEIEGALRFVEYIDNNIIKVKKVFEKIYTEAIEEWIEKKRKADAVSISKGTAEQIVTALDTYSMNFLDVPEDDPRFNPRATAAKALMIWYKDSWDKMMDTERRVLINQFLRPVQQGSLSTVHASDPSEEGTTPRHWTEQVQQALREAGAGWTVVNSYRWEGPSYGRIYQSFASPDSARYEVWDEAPEPPGQPEAAAGGPIVRNARGERMADSIEDQIERIDNLLNEKASPIDLRIYRTQLGCSIDRSIGGAEMEIETQIRGIEGVTIVRSVATAKRPLTATTNYAMFEIKFELMGATSRKEYREAVLFPGLRRIPGLNIIDWSSIHRTNVRGTVRTVRENLLKEFGFTNTPYTSQHSNINQMVTPRPALQTMIDDWSEGGVQLYDMPTDMSNSSNHIMMPVEELVPLCNSVYRSDLRDFRGRYQNFISQGAQLPVHLAIGQNGRAVITGNEDLVWFAQKAGLEELPVFIRYQKQV